MKKIILESIIPILVILPAIWFYLKANNRKTYFQIFIFSVVFLINYITLRLPQEFNSLRFINGNWNWNGKIYATAISIVLYILLKKRLGEYNYFTLKDNSLYSKKTTIVSIGIVLFSLFYFFSSSISLNYEKLAFQFLMPGIEEEIVFRGLLLGLLMPILQQKITIQHLNFGNPSVLIIGILFGFVHAFKVDENISFDLNYFIGTFTFGYLWGWITIKSGSIIKSVLSHNFSNFLTNIILMFK